MTATSRSFVTSTSRLGLLLLGLGTPALVAAVALDPGAGRSAAAQDWPAFVLVGGLILVGLVASETKVFEQAGLRLAALPGGDLGRYICAVAVTGVVSAILNLDTAALFVTPVLIQMCRSRRMNEAPMLYGCLLLSNAGSLLLPGSNLTNIIVSGHSHQSGAAFASEMAPIWAAALVVTAIVVGIAHRRDLVGLKLPLGRSPLSRITPTPALEADRDRSLWFGLVVALIACAAVVGLHSAAAALCVAGLGVVAVTIEIVRRRVDIGATTGALDVPVLVGLFEIAVALGVLGREWDLPARAFAHLGTLATAGAAALASVIFNNLPAASFLAARVPAHPYALLIGLDIGPNLFVTGSLSWFLWLRAARQAGAEPSIWHATKLGLWAAPLAIASAVGVLAIR
ncbi:MAG: SLC13 family permease [Acidimicrobiales bacterium]